MVLFDSKQTGPGDGRRGRERERRGEKIAFAGPAATLRPFNLKIDFAERYSLSINLVFKEKGSHCGWNEGMLMLNVPQTVFIRISDYYERCRVVVR